MAVCVVGVVKVVEPFLQLAVAAYTHDRKAVHHSLQAVAVGVVSVEQTCGGESRAEGVAYNLVVHGAACGNGRRGFATVDYGTVLRRQRRRAHEHSVMGGVRNKVAHVEIGRSFYGGVMCPYEFGVAAVKVVRPQMRGQPCTSVGPCAEIGEIDHPGRTPYVGVVMRYPSACAVVGACGFGTLHRQLVHEAEQRLMAFCKVGWFGRPVVHLCVDIDGVFAVPRGKPFAAPQALQVGRLGAGLRTAYEQIASVLEQERRERRVVVGSERCHAHICRADVCFTIAEVQLYTAELGVVYIPVGGIGFVKRESGSGVEDVACA